MAKFKYRMQNILDIKIKLEDQEKIAFGIASAKVNEEQEKLKALMVRKAGYEKQLKDLSQGAINVSDIKICKNSIDAMKSSIRDQMIVLSRAQRDLDIARKRLNDVMMERKMHENLRDKAFKSFMQEELRMEGKVTDELVSYTYSERNIEE